MKRSSATASRGVRQRGSNSRFQHLIAGERRRDSIPEILDRVQAACGSTLAAISSITVFELTHGIYRAKTDSQRLYRQRFVEALYQAVAVHPLSFEVAQLAGRIHGEQMGKGISIDFPDLLIGATAIHLGFNVATLNVKHFQAIPGLAVVNI